MSWDRLRELIEEYLSLEEVRTLCFDLNIDYDSLSGEGKTAKVRELITLCRRSDRVTDLIARLSKIRPNASWGELNLNSKSVKTPPQPDQTKPLTIEPLTVSPEIPPATPPVVNTVPVTTPTSKDVSASGYGLYLVVFAVVALVIYGSYTSWRSTIQREVDGTVVRLYVQTETAPVCVSLGGCPYYDTDAICYVEIQHKDGKLEGLETHIETSRSSDGEYNGPNPCRYIQGNIIIGDQYHFLIKGDKIVQYMAVAT